jgi:hypothetical protein
MSILHEKFVQDWMCVALIQQCTEFANTFKTNLFNWEVGVFSSEGG